MNNRSVWWGGGRCSETPSVDRNGARHCDGWPHPLTLWLGRLQQPPPGPPNPLLVFAHRCPSCSPRGPLGRSVCAPPTPCPVRINPEAPSCGGLPLAPAAATGPRHSLIPTWNAVPCRPARRPPGGGQESGSWCPQAPRQAAPRLWSAAARAGRTRLGCLTPWVCWSSHVGLVPGRRGLSCWAPEPGTDGTGEGPRQLVSWTNGSLGGERGLA